MSEWTAEVIDVEGYEELKTDGTFAAESAAAAAMEARHSLTRDWADVDPTDPFRIRVSNDSEELVFMAWGDVEITWRAEPDEPGEEPA